MGQTKRDVYFELDEHFGIEAMDELTEQGFSFRGLTIYVNGKKVSVQNVVYYYAHDARNITSGCRRLGPHVGDWRPIDYLAKTCLEIYKVLKLEELKREARKYDMELRA